MIRIITVIIIWTLTAMAQPVGYSNVNSDWDGLLRYIIASEKITYVAGDTVRLYEDVTNWSIFDRVLHYPTSQVYDFALVNGAGDTLWQASAGQQFDSTAHADTLGFLSPFRWAMDEFIVDSGWPGGDYTVIGWFVTDDPLPNPVPLTIKIQTPTAINIGQKLIPLELELVNYPNPFNAATIIRYTLPNATQLRITIYNILGQEIAILHQDWQTAGLHQLHWNARNLPSGLYLCRLQTGSGALMKRLLLIK